MLETFEPKLGKVVSKFMLKLEKLLFLEPNKCSKSKSSCSMKLEFDEMWAHSCTS